MPKSFLTILALAFMALFVFNACGGKNAASAAANNSTRAPKATVQSSAAQNAQPTLPSVTNGENGGEGGTEAALVTYADAAQHFSIGYPGPWTRDTTVKQGVKFVGGDDSLTPAFLTLPQGQSAMAFAQNDSSLNALPQYKQIGLAASTAVKDAIVLGFEAQGKSAITGKTLTERQPPRLWARWFRWRAQKN